MSSATRAASLSPCSLSGVSSEPCILRWRLLVVNDGVQCAVSSTYYSVWP